MKRILLHLIAAILVAAPAFSAQDPAAGTGFDRSAAEARIRLEESLRELAELQTQIGDELIPLSERLNLLEAELLRERQAHQTITAALDRGALELSVARSAANRSRESFAYLTTLFGQYVREFEVRLHISELATYRGVVEVATRAPEDGNLSEAERLLAQAGPLDASLNRLESLLGGDRVTGSAIGPSGRMVPGRFLLVGPTTLFASNDGAVVGTAEQRLGSLEASVVPFASPEDAAAAANLIKAGAGEFPIDPTLGNAHKMEETRHETFADEFKKGGPVMYPIFLMAGLALLIACFKWLSLMVILPPSSARLKDVLAAAACNDQEEAAKAAAKLHGPLGRMLQAGVDHMRAPRELVEEVMYETILTTKLRVQRLLPFLAICAASAPLLGLLGTVTGIINTFRIITVYGSGDVKSLSGGISEALITTKWGLIVAIPALLVSAFLTRKARGITSRMETVAMQFSSRLAAAPDRDGGEDASDAADAGSVREQVNQILRGMLEPVLTDEPGATQGTARRVT